MICTDVRSRLHPYLDRELGFDASLAIESHLASCADCRAALESQSALQAAIRRHATHHAAPAGLARRIRSQLGEPEDSAVRKRPATWRWPRLDRWLPLGAAVAATAILSWTVAVQYTSVSGDERLAEQVVASYARATLTGHGIDVASSDQHTVKPWLSGRLDFSPAPVDLANAGFPLAGGRLDYVADRPVATLVYRYRQHVIDLFVWPQANPGSDASLRTFARKGYNVLRWREGGMAYWAVSDVNEADMRAFVDTYIAAK